MLLFSLSSFIRLGSQFVAFSLSSLEIHFAAASLSLLTQFAAGKSQEGLSIFLSLFSFYTLEMLSELYCTLIFWQKTINQPLLKQEVFGLVTGVFEIPRITRCTEGTLEGAKSPCFVSRSLTVGSVQCTYTTVHTCSEKFMGEKF